MQLPFKVEKRLTTSRTASFLVPVASMLLALVFGGFLLLAAGANPLVTYKAMLEGALGTPSQWAEGEFYNLSETLVKAIPLMLCGLGVSIAFRMLFWNIGAEGQLAMGGFAAAGVALFWAEHIPDPLLLPTMFVAGFLGGALWALLPALLKALLNVNEIIVTLMMNYIAVLWIEYLFYGPWKDPQGYGFPGSAQFPKAAWLPRLPGTRLHLGLVFAVGAALFIWVVLVRTKWGYEIRVIGENPRAASYAGISLVRNIILVMILSGGLAGLAGMSEVAGISHRLQKGLTVGYGFTAIIVAWLGRLNPLAVILTSLLFGGLLVGGDALQVAMGLPMATINIFNGVILFFVLGGELLTRYKIALSR